LKGSGRRIVEEKKIDEGAGYLIRVFNPSQVTCKITPSNYAFSIANNKQNYKNKVYQMSLIINYYY